ncbi:hypothetical protein FKW77_001111 [Venturia effusa]|uniref:Transcription factor domain-containing protein n=1 Tax=Venturia effusa TaxID=50376 RepID=A0A517LES2_9PEZI|nr:hypothetical protein FKW77_001111 [Venturia effusa]
MSAPPDGTLLPTGQILDSSNGPTFNQLLSVLNTDEATRLSRLPPQPVPSAISNPSNDIFTCLDGPSPAHSAGRRYPLESEAELEDYLRTYRTKMVLYCPIVPLEEDTTLESMNKDHPFLWLVIRAVCSKSSTRQRALELQIRQTLGREMLIEGTKSRDMLMGTLVFAAWGHYFVTSKPISQPVMMLAMSLAYDLGLNRPIPSDPVTVMLNFNSQGCPKPVFAGQSSFRTIQERRTILGLFLISSVYANYFGRIDHLPWTSYLDECLQILEEKMEVPTDAILVQLVRIQLLCNRVATIPWRTTSVPQSFFVKTLASDLESLTRTLPPSLESNETLQLATFHAIIVMHEHSLDTCPSATSTLERLDSLWACLSATKSWFALFFCLNVIPILQYPQLAMPIFNQLAHCLIVLFRLSTFELPNWDRKRVRQEVNLGATVKLMASRWEEVATAANLNEGNTQDILGAPSDPDHGPWAYTRKKLLVVAHFWEMKLASMMQSEEGAPTISRDNDFTLSTSEQQQMNQMDFSNMDWLNDIWMSDYSGFELPGAFA